MASNRRLNVISIHCVVICTGKIWFVCEQQILGYDVWSATQQNSRVSYLLCVGTMRYLFGTLRRTSGRLFCGQAMPPLSHTPRWVPFSLHPGSCDGNQDWFLLSLRTNVMAYLERDWSFIVWIQNSVSVVCFFWGCCKNLGAMMKMTTLL